MLHARAYTLDSLARETQCSARRVSVHFLVDRGVCIKEPLGVGPFLGTSGDRSRTEWTTELEFHSPPGALADQCSAAAPVYLLMLVLISLTSCQSGVTLLALVGLL